MCLGGGQQSYPAPKYLKREDPPWGRLEDPPDLVNDKEIEISDTGSFNRNVENLKAPKSTAQTSKTTGGAK